MDYHVSRKVVLNPESKFSSLYRWSLQEFGDADKQTGSDQIPWNSSLVFTATEFSLCEELNLKVKVPLLTDLTRERLHELAPEKEERTYIFAELRPGYWGVPERAERYSMFGTEREVKWFKLYIHPLPEGETERCHAWGCLSYTTDFDFRNEAADDTVIFYLHVSTERFQRYVEMVRKYPASIASLRLGMVDGFYSEWSPAVSTHRIKVLTNLEDHKITIPEGVTITPPTLGWIGEFNLTFNTKRIADKPPRTNVEGDEQADAPQSPEEASLSLQRAALKLAVANQQRIKQISYAAWAAVALLALIWGAR